MSGTGSTRRSVSASFSRTRPSTRWRKPIRRSRPRWRPQATAGTISKSTTRTRCTRPAAMRSRGSPEKPCSRFWRIAAERWGSSFASSARSSIRRPCATRTSWSPRTVRTRSSGNASAGISARSWTRGRTGLYGSAPQSRSPRLRSIFRRIGMGSGVCMRISTSRDSPRSSSKRGRRPGGRPGWTRRARERPSRFVNGSSPRSWTGIVFNPIGRSGGASPRFETSAGITTT